MALPELALQEERHERFVAEYLVDLSVTQAYVRAGYKAKNADVTAYRLFARPEIQAAIRAALGKVLAEVQITPGKILRDLEETRMRALGDGSYSAAVRASELQARYVNAFPDDYGVPLAPDAGTETTTPASLADLARGLAFVLSAARREQSKPAQPVPVRTLQ